ncbi:hypothetical protein [Bacillus cereus]|uniref:hypothetical protein n=1 Tax=Bacillus cereus TaxID=1396 RepID=UPI0010BD8FFA|nr:hypothetical protein [Bacillus cereus]TKH79740.1 hypothetical protein FC688_16840 [Bacillus cereus]
MKGSEVILRAMHQVGGEIPATQFDTWLGQLSQLGLLEQVTKDDKHVYYYRLTDNARQFLAKKGVI